MKKTLLILVAGVMLIILGAVYAQFRTTVPRDNGGTITATGTPGDKGKVACTMEAKRCSDGSYVGRVGPKCEFAACPNPNPAPKDNAIIRGQVLLGPTCPVMRNPPDPQCADKPYSTRLALALADGTEVVKEFSSDKSGAFNITAPAGDYSISNVASGNILPRCGSETFHVSVGETKSINVFCDTGIR